MVFCENCGKELNEGVTVCPECGTSTAVTQAANQNQVQSNYSAPVHQVYQAPPMTKEEMVTRHKYSTIKFKKILSLVMIIVTSITILTGLISLIPLNGSYEEATKYANRMSYITSQAGNTIDESYFQKHGDFLENEVTITYTTACLISGFYQTFLFLSLLFWIYLFRKSSFQKKLFEATGELE